MEIAMLAVRLPTEGGQRVAERPQTGIEGEDFGVRGRSEIFRPVHVAERLPGRRVAKDEARERTGKNGRAGDFLFQIFGGATGRGTGGQK